MKILNCEQRSLEWLQARIGRITSSNAHRLLTPAKLKTYAYELATELLTRTPTMVPTNTAMQWGIDNEPKAKAWYELENWCDVETVGFCIIEDTHFGASPDGLVGEEGLIEIKCPFNSRIHLEHKYEGPCKDYMAQMQWQMFVTNRKWCDFVSYDPRMPSSHRGHIQRVERDEEMIEQLQKGAQKIMEIIEKLHPPTPS